MKVVIVGTGIAGLSAALSAYEAGDEVVVLTKAVSLQHSASTWAQGGIAYWGGQPDSLALFKQDILKAAAGMARPEAVALLVSQGPRCLEEILFKKVKVPFTKIKAKPFPKASALSTPAAYALAGEAAHSVRRILFYEDSTGRVVVQQLFNYLKANTTVQFLTQHLVLDLINLPHHSKDPLAVYEPIRCVGLYALNLKTQQVEKFFSDKIILATGGIGSLYQHTTNPPGSTGDGIALAKRAGARIVNLEFTQFHPTTLAVKAANNFLISEALRGEGAFLINEHGVPFMKQYHPLGSLAPRDVVARAIVKEQAEQEAGLVYLAAQPGEARVWKHRFPKILAACHKFKIDFPSEPIPITPAFHFSCGGILTNLEGQTSIENLFAAGECACTGVHGANRLASTSLLEGLLFGFLAGKSRKQMKVGEAERSRVKDWELPQHYSLKADSLFLQQNFTQLKSIMWNYVGVIRKKAHLALALSQLNEIQTRIEAYYRYSPLRKELIELRNATQAALLVATAAIKNPLSCGCHFVEE